VTSDKQTLILAGEPIPRRDTVEAPLTIVATRADDTMLLPQSDFEKKQAGGEFLYGPMVPMPAAGSNKLSHYDRLAYSRGASFSAANEYARTQDLSDIGSRTAIIDTYA
jgi:hypothetical protein